MTLLYQKQRHLQSMKKKIYALFSGRTLVFRGALSHQLLKGRWKIGNISIIPPFPQPHRPYTFRSLRQEQPSVSCIRLYNFKMVCPVSLLKVWLRCPSLMPSFSAISPTVRSGCRIQKATLALKSGKYKVYEVAEMAGYRDITYFSTTFKKLVGKSPSEYQSTAGNNA